MILGIFSKQMLPHLPAPNPPKHIGLGGGWEIERGGLRGEGKKCSSHIFDIECY